MTTILDKFNLANRVAVFTGGAGLLGTEFCWTLAEAGAAVAVVDLNAEKCAGVAEPLTKAGYRALPIPTDITQPESVKALVEKVMSAYGRLDILVNSAALNTYFGTKMNLLPDNHYFSADYSDPPLFINVDDRLEKP